MDSVTSGWIYLAFVFVIHAIRLPYQWCSRLNRVVAHRVTTIESALLAGIGAGMIVIPALSVLTPLLRFADYVAPRYFSALGILMIAPTLWLFWLSHRALGRHWSITLEVHAEQQLVTQGIYARIRHPMYAAAWLWALAQVLLIPNIISGLSGLVTFGALYFWRVREEEAMLVSQFGDEYTAYAARTPRLLPRR